MRKKCLILRKKIIDYAKKYWLRFLPIEEMPDIASVICEGYRNNLLTENQAMSGMNLVKKEIVYWINENNKLHDKMFKKIN